MINLYAVALIIDRLCRVAPNKRKESVNERSASALRRLHNYMRASMGNSRLSSLALLHMHYDMDVDLDEVVTRYAHLHPRKFELDSIIRP